VTRGCASSEGLYRMGSLSGSVKDPAQSGHGGRSRFVFDAKRSRFTVQAFATGFLSAMGHSPTIAIRKFDGEVEFDPEALEASALRLTIQAASLAVQDDINDKDRREMERLMWNEVLEVEKYPEITYEASPITVAQLDAGFYSANLNGDLRFHGITRKQPLTVRIAALGTTLRASAHFTLNQSDYQIKPVSVAAGALKLKDELRFAFDVLAQSQETTQNS
jgi:polyisoprenoid-binding protein YceI